MKKLKDWLYKSKFKGLFATDGSLSQKTARSGVWVFGSFGFSKVLFFIQTIILVRLLTPEDFGLMGICYVAIAGMAVFTNTGFNQALIQRKDNNDNVLNTAWVISVIRGVVLFLLLFILAPFIAKFYDNATIEPILRIIAFSFLFSGFSNIGLILYSKELNFKKKVVYDQITAILSIMITVGLAFWLRNVWALVIGHVFGAVVGVSLSYWAHPFRPKFQFKVNIAKELFHFGKHIFLSGIVIFLFTQGDDALVGKVLGISALGFYYLAYKISNLPATAITHVISSVSFPAYSKVQDDINRLAKAYLKILKMTVFMSLPIAAGLFVLAPEFIRIVYGDKWMSIIPAMQVLCIFGAIRSIGATTGPLFQSVNKPELIWKFNLGQVIVALFLIYPLTKAYNILGTSVSITLAILIFNIVALFCVSQIINIRVIDILKIILKPLIASIFMVFTVYFLRNVFCINITALIFLISCGILIYAFALYLIDRKGFTDIFDSFKLIN